MHTLRLFVVIVGLALVLLAAGCGAEPLATATAVPPTAAPTTESASPQPTEIPTAAASSGLSQEEMDELLAAHNALRSQFGSPALTWNGEVAASAQEWAETNAANESLEPRPDSPYGENSWAGTSGAYSLTSVVDSWGAAAADFDIETGQCKEGGACWSFTQVIWADTLYLGCGRATGANGNDYVVCDYDPPGNYAGESAIAGSAQPTQVAQVAPTGEPTALPAEVPTQEPNAEPTGAPADIPTAEPAENPTNVSAAAVPGAPAPMATEVPAQVTPDEPDAEATGVPAQGSANPPVPEPTTASAEPPANGALTDAEKKIMLDKHNEWRARYNMPPLVWDDTVAAFSQSWANHLAETGNFLHSIYSGYGENLWMGSSGVSLPASAVDDWGNEANDYDLNTNTCAPGKVCGHFAQVVWRNSTKLGCARASGSGNDYIVCSYDPPGNLIGQNPFGN